MVDMIGMGIIYFLIITAGFIIKGIVGFGDPLITVPGLSIFLPTSTITPGLSINGPIMNGRIVWKNRKLFNPWFVVPITTINLVGSFVGIPILKYYSPQVLKLLLGGLIIFLGIEMLTRKPSTEEKRINWAVCLPISFISGVFSGIFGINMILVAYLERVNSQRDIFKTNMCFVFFIENIFRVILYIIMGLYSKDSLMLAAIALPAGLLGMYLGGRIDKKIDDVKAHTMMSWVFILGGVSTVIYSLISLIQG